MKSRFSFISSILGFIFLCLCASLFSPAEASLVSDNLVEEGIKLYEKKEYDKAIEQFSKALIIDPDNPKAKEYLQKMGMERGLYQPEQGSSISPLKEMSKEIQDYKNQLTALEEEKFKKEKLARTLEEDKAYWKEAIEAQSRELDGLREELQKMQGEVSEQKKLQESLKADSDHSSERAAMLDASAFRLKKRVSQQLTLIGEKDRQIKQLQKRLKSAEKEGRQKRISYENKLLDVKKEHRKEQLKDWQKEVKKDQKIEFLRSRLETSRVEIASLNDSLLLVNRRLASLEKNLTVKNNTIIRLNKTLATQREACAGLKTESSEKSSEESEPAIPADCPDPEALKERDKKIAALKDQLAEAQEQIVSLKQNVAQSGQADVAALKRQLADLEDKLQKKDATSSDDEASYDILEQRLRDAQERLNVANQMIQKKDKQIKDMEKQIGDIEKR